MSAADAARRWGAVEEPRLIKDRENAVYEIALKDGARAALRLHRAGYQSDAAIRSELWWMTRLADAGLPLPMPIQALDGEFLAKSGGRTASVVSWVEGDQFGDGETPLPADAEWVGARYSALGRLIAEMHDVTDALELPEGFDRPRWGREAYTGPDPLWGRFWENPALTVEEADLMHEARERMDASLATFERDGADVGLIHADLLRENVLVEGEDLSIIDFDDCGFGFRTYDLATALVQGIGDPMYSAARSALCSGYRQARHVASPLADDVELFVALRCFASAGWIMTRADPRDPKMRFYAERAVNAARLLVG